MTATPDDHVMPSIEEILDDTTPALVHLGTDAVRAGMRVVRYGNVYFDIERGFGLDDTGRPLWGMRVYLTERNTFLVAKRYDGPHVTTVHSIREIRQILFEEPP